jgi:hypothetical protein
MSIQSEQRDLMPQNKSVEFSKKIGQKKPICISLAVALIICLNLSGRTFAQNLSKVAPVREDFLKELLSGRPGPKTLWYDASMAGSYQINKLDLAKALPESAKAENVTLLGFLAIGPSAPPSVYYFYTFAQEQDHVRVNESTFAVERFNYKATGTMTPASFQAFWDTLLGADVLNSGTPQDPGGKTSADTEAAYDVLLARWSGGKLDSYYGSIAAPKKGARIAEFGKPIGQLLNSLTKTFPFLPPPLPSPTPKPNKPGML